MGTRVKLIVAVGSGQALELQEMLEERTAGRWRHYLLISNLGEDKTSNNSDIETLVASHSVTPIIAIADKTSTSLEVNPMVRRLTRDQINLQVNKWLEQSGLCWRSNATECSKKGVFEWMEWGEWKKQFELVDPDKGSRVAAAILAQLHIVTNQELSGWFDGLESVDHSVYYIGSDPHSGDHGLVNLLSSRIDGKHLSDVQKIPNICKESKVRYFGDAAWSGGEVGRRISCLFTECENKKHSLSTETTLFIRLAFITDVGEDNLRKEIDQLHEKKMCDRGKVKISVPPYHRLEVNQYGSNSGLAFQNPDILNYVNSDDPNFMRTICKRIGKQIVKSRELGTDDIASTIGFEFSLPRAMLPVLIYGGRQVKASDGTMFTWKPLIKSKHIIAPAATDQSAHCLECPLQPVKKQQSEIAVLPASEFDVVEGLPLSVPPSLIQRTKQYLKRCFKWLTRYRK